MSFEEFQDGRHGGHLGYRNGMILAILNLYVAMMSPIKFRLNLSHSLKMSERDDFSDSESLLRSNASHQVSAQSGLWFGRRCRLKNFKMAAVTATLDIGMNRF